MDIHGQGCILIADHREHAVNLRWVGIHNLTHVRTIKSEIPAAFMNPELGFSSMGFYVQIYTQIYLRFMNETHCVHVCVVGVVEPRPAHNRGEEKGIVMNVMVRKQHIRRVCYRSF